MSSGDVKLMAHATDMLVDVGRRREQDDVRKAALMAICGEEEKILASATTDAAQVAQPPSSTSSSPTSTTSTSSSSSSSTRSRSTQGEEDEIDEWLPGDVQATKKGCAKHAAPLLDRAMRLSPEPLGEGGVNDSVSVGVVVPSRVAMPSGVVKRRHDAQILFACDASPIGGAERLHDAQNH